MNELLIAVPESEYNKLLERDEFLRSLEEAGVDNWEGYDIAIDIREGWNSKKE